MGWSCTTAASMTLEAIGDLADMAPSKNGVRSANTFRTARGTWAFWETGREQRDGAIVGSVWEFNVGHDVNAESGQAYKRGSIRIEPDGKVKRFALMPKQVLRDAEQRGIATWGERYPREPHPAFEHKHSDMDNRCVYEHADGRIACDYEQA